MTSKTPIIGKKITCASFIYQPDALAPEIEVKVEEFDGPEDDPAKMVIVYNNHQLVVANVTVPVLIECLQFVMKNMEQKEVE